MKYIAIALLSGASLLGSPLTGSAQYSVNPVGSQPGCANSYVVNGPINTGTVTCPPGSAGTPGVFSFTASSSSAGMSANAYLQAGFDPNSLLGNGTGSYSFVVSQDFIVLGGTGLGMLTFTYQQDIYQDTVVSGLNVLSLEKQFTYGVPFTVTFTASGSVGPAAPTRNPAPGITFNSNSIYDVTPRIGLPDLLTLNPNAFIVTEAPAPVPEPASFALLGAGLGAFCWLRRRGQRA